ncbi:hypothetical protein FJZ31_32400 [Candidatus Poribacteria bacterium]|nr:hypothetical protein [Candidatus Poribacteria bacterium]
MNNNQVQFQWIPEVSLSPFMERFLPYKGQYVAVQADRLIAHPRLAEVLREARASGKPFTIYAIPGEFGKLRILPIRIRSLGFHFWNPMYDIAWQCTNGSWLDSQTLVDSGADVSVIPLELGQELGFTLLPEELRQQAIGLSGTLDIVLRQAVVRINEVTATIPVAWVQESAFTDVILGRAVVFDLFDITFKQAEETIIFVPRETKC